MRVDAVKCSELKSVLKKWLNKTVASKTDLQSILGKLLWVSKAVKFSRCFVMRIIAEVKKIKISESKSKIESGCQEGFSLVGHLYETF